MMKSNKKYKTNTIRKAVIFQKKAKRKKMLLFCILLFVVLCILSVILHKHKAKQATTQTEATTTAKTKETKEEKENTDILPWYHFRAIAHALGGIDGKMYVNSSDCFIENYKNGFRLFEVDLLMTTDNVLVARHYWDEDSSIPNSRGTRTPRSYKEFKSAKFYGKYNPTSFDELLDLLEKYPDAYIMTDTKARSYSGTVEYLTAIVTSAKKHKNYENLLGRLVIQIYNESMLSAVKNVYNFENILYTTYRQSELEFSRIIKFCKANNIKAVTVPTDEVNDYRMKLMNDADIYCYTNTVNSQYLTKEYMKLGIYGVYTDFVSSAEVEEAAADVYLDSMIDTFVDHLKQAKR